VVSGGYEDDEDYGEVIIYTGAGGRDPATGKQVADQTLTAQNLALARSGDLGLPVRVVRGAGGDPAYSPPSGLRYDGTFYVDHYWPERGRSGFVVWRYRLIQEPIDELALSETPADTSGPVDREQVVVQRQIRNTGHAIAVKKLHDSFCQICGERIETKAGPYAEGAHIRPLGRPHDGSDAISNILCLCPNDHIRFDRGALYIDESLNVVDARSGETIGPLRQHRSHPIDLDSLDYHRRTWRDSE
jgi:putative restriction endonuclease